MTAIPEVKSPLEATLALPPYNLPQAEKERWLLAELNALTAHHRARCPAYDRLLTVREPAPAKRLADLPFLPVGLFKSHLLASVPEEAVFKTLTSSGTTGQTVSRIILDRETAQLQSTALAALIGHLIGPQRLPMLIADHPGVIRDPRGFSARGAGVMGMMTFGRSHTFLLDQEMRLDLPGLERFLAAHGRSPFLIFGFTFMVWQSMINAIAGLGLDLSQGILIHSGGWKKLQDEAVDNAAFKARLFEVCGLSRIYNFYGMVEQVGSVFIEGEDGYLYPPRFADVIVRDPTTWQEAPTGTPGVIQVLSALPRSYPGHSLLTEDWGVVHGIDDSGCQRAGKRFSVLGRVPHSELRGCSDTHAFGAAGP